MRKKGVYNTILIYYNIIISLVKIYHFNSNTMFNNIIVYRYSYLRQHYE